MALRRIGAIAAHLRAAGRDAAEPVAFITEATTPRQSVAITTLAEAERTAATIPSHAPTLIVIGPVVALRPLLAAWPGRRAARSKENAMLPETAPFPAEQIVALNSIISRTNAEQRTWLSGFLAGYQAANAPQPAAAAPPARRAPLTILFGTESGNAETLADAARKAAGKLGFAARVLDMADATPAQVAGAQNLLVIASTWGEGDPPQRAIDFYAALMADDAPRFDGVRYAVLALGDRAYAKFCETGRRVRRSLRRAGCHAGGRADRVRPGLRNAGRRLDRRDAGHAAGGAWASRRRARSSTSISPAPPAEVAAWSRARPFEAEVTERIRLSGSRSTSDTWHVELSLEGAGIAYEPGDSLGFVPANDPALVDAVLAATGLSGNAQLRAAAVGASSISPR